MNERFDAIRDLQDGLRQVRRRWLYATALRVWTRAAVGAAVIIAAAAAAEFWLAPADAGILVLAGVAIAGVLGMAVVAAWPHRRRPDDLRVARFVEEQCPELEDEVLSAASIAQRPGSDEGGFGTIVVASAAQRLRDLRADHVIPGETLRRASVRGGAAAAVLAGACVLAWPFARDAAQAARLRLFPGAIHVQVLPGNVRLPAGNALRIVARLTDGGTPLTRITPTLTIESGGRVRRVPMVSASDGFELRIPNVDRSFHYRVQAGGALSDAYRVEALVPPRIAGIDLHYEYPRFTGLPPRDQRDGGDIYGPAGTQVRITVRTDKPGVNGRLALSDNQPAIDLRTDGRSLTSTLRLAVDGSYRVTLRDRDGLEASGTEYFIRLLDDSPPEVHVLRPAGDQQITPLEEVTIEARADDDYGVENLELVYAVGGGKRIVVPFERVTGTAVSKTGSRMLAAEGLNVKPGDVVAYYARARDVPRGKRSTVAQSEIFFLEVTPFGETFTSAESQAMAAAMGTQIDSLVAAQKEIISATWNIERRSSIGRSAADVKAVAAAQAELKARAEQAAGSDPPQIHEPPQQIQGPAAQDQPDASDPIAAAVAAMQRAMQELEASRTSGALPHEMAALNALLRAQAEVRRRQVVQQANGAGAGGTGRQEQDLSALFDRELKRQQRTNYETNAQIEQRPDRASGYDALDRIRDLAKRQEELGRRQRELADAKLSEEERRRELERLTREQQELQQQVEELARQQAGAQQSQQGRGRSGQSGTASTLRDAAGQMQGATSDLQRDDASSAATRAGKASARLRELERRMEAATPDGRKRALGDLQLEAQQIAESQRRAAGQAKRLDDQGGGTADDRRALAAQKDALAARVDALEKRSRALSNTTGMEAADREATAGAARTLEQERVAEQMRQGAARLRDGDGRGQKPDGRSSLAPDEEALARRMDDVARQMNGADAGGAGSDTQRLADELDRARAARDRLARLERRMADAEKASKGRQGGHAGREGPAGRAGAQGAGGAGQGSGDLDRLREEYGRELQRTRDLLDSARQSSEGGSTPEEHEWSRSAPGTELWKQDYAGWDALRKDVHQALEQYEASVAEQLSRARAIDRLRAGGSTRIPDGYQQRVARYFESIAKGGAKR